MATRRSSRPASTGQGDFVAPEPEPMQTDTQPPPPAAAAAAAGSSSGDDSFDDMSEADEEEQEVEDVLGVLQPGGVEAQQLLIGPGGIGWETEDEDEDEFEVEDSEDEDEFEEEEEGEEGATAGTGAALGHAGIMSLLFGRHRSLPHTLDVFRDLPRLPLPLAPLRGDLAAGLNRGSRGLDIGQADPIWACLDTSCDAIELPPTSTAQQQARQQQQSGFKRIFPPPEPQHPADGTAAGAGAADSSYSSRKAARRQQESAAAAAAGGSSGSRGAGSSLSGAISSMVAAAAAAASSGVSTRSSVRRRAGTGSAAAAAAEPAGDPESAAAAAAAGSPRSNSSSSSSTVSGHSCINTACLLFKREVALGRQYGFSRSQQVHLGSRTFPVFPQKVRDHMHSRAYIGQYSSSGEFFIAAYQDRRVRLYDTTRDWALRKDVTTRMTRWTITDTTMSPDQRLLVYASISPVAFVVNVGSSYDLVESQANITEVHEPLAFDGRYAQGADTRRRGGAGSDSDEDWDAGSFGIWSIAWSPQGGQLIAGTNGNAVFVYDIESKRCLTKLTNHGDDVNAVAYLREGDPHLIVSGSDDSLVRVWDLRDRRGTLRAPQGVLVGHSEGLTHVCPKGDGLHLISNCKDQTIKLWDTRAAVSPAQAAAAGRNRPRIPHWDYRWEDYPAAGYAVHHPDDVSLMTYRGHAVLQTLVRAYFSPAHSTGQRFIYAGNAEGDILVWDVVSGKQVSKLQYHQSLVRDCSWHPYEPELTSVSWDGRIISWGVNPPGKALSRHAD